MTEGFSADTPLSCATGRRGGKLLTLRDIFRNDKRVGERRTERGPAREAGVDRRTSLADRRTRTRYFGLGLLCLGLATPARAQIYTWRDANGNLVLGNHRPSGSVVQTYAVPQAPAIRVTRPVVLSRTGLYDTVITQHARLNSIRPDLVRAVVQVESAFNPFARSPKGALGLMQLMPETIHQFGVKNPFDPNDNVRAGTAYLRQLLDRYENHEQLALAAYNAGPGAVDKYGQTVPPYRETRDYVRRITSINEAARPIQIPGRVFYKTIDMVDGRSMPRYSDRKPASGSYEVVNR